MTAKFEFEHDGYQSLVATLEHMETKGANRAARKAIRAGAKPIVKAARENAPIDTGALKKSIGKSVKLLENGVRVKIGPRRSYSKHGRQPGRYAHLVEHGYVASDGRHVPAHPFLRPAVDEKGEEAQKAMADRLQEALVEEAKRGGS